MIQWCAPVELKGFARCENQGHTGATVTACRVLRFSIGGKSTISGKPSKDLGNTE